MTSIKHIDDIKTIGPNKVTKETSVNRGAVWRLNPASWPPRGWGPNKGGKAACEVVGELQENGVPEAKERKHIIEEAMIEVAECYWSKQDEDWELSIGFGNAGSLVTLIRTVSWSGGDEGEVGISSRENGREENRAIKHRKPFKEFSVKTTKERYRVAEFLFCYSVWWEWYSRVCCRLPTKKQITKQSFRFQ